MTRIFKYEYFIYGQWHEYDPDKYSLRTKHEYETLVHRAKFDYREDCKQKQEHWYLGGMRHRLDGPAWIVDHDGFWYVEGILLHEFDEYFDCKKPSESIFNYIQKYPQNLKEIELLCIHNRWLNEDELVLLKTMSLFK